MTHEKNPVPGATGSGADSRKLSDYSALFIAKTQTLILTPWPHLAPALSLAALAWGWK